MSNTSRSIENQLLSAWNSFPNFITQWCMNFSTDLLFFSLGAITITVNLTRFIMNNLASFQLDDASGNTLCTAEMTTAVIIVCLPGLKKLIKRSKLSTQTDNSSQSGLGVATVSSAPLKSQQTTQSYADWGVKDCDIELVPEGEDYLRMPDLVVLKSQGP
ncbi:hypothetical protein EDB82DRAFT_547745 [Fusarium venenatum]|uniref:uncharacterized protein n=1 Tax=Fusarium venenatum TaxID=56646 RepID=UPI001D5A2461|nr:hypothetical protein EDB82DRAFT_547745 [Fusarium venenatum]